MRPSLHCCHCVDAREAEPGWLDSGGWACILRFGSAKKELFGYDPHTTNNRMELMAAIQGLLAVKEPCAVEVTTDAEYVRQGVTVWVKHWKRRHWWKKNRPIRNADLWIELDALAAFHQTEWIWTKGHAGHVDNDRCDWLAQNAARTRRTHPSARPGRDIFRAASQPLYDLASMKMTTRAILASFDPCR